MNWRLKLPINHLGTEEIVPSQNDNSTNACIEPLVLSEESSEDEDYAAILAVSILD